MKNMLEVFGKNYFSELQLKSRVPSSIFKEFKAVQRGEKELSISVAEVIANALFLKNLKLFKEEKKSYQYLLRK